MIAKNYPYYDEVVKLLTHILNSQGIQILQLGGKDDPPVPGCVNLLGKTDFHQSCYILKNSLCHVGNDSWPVHRAGEIKVPLVALYGSTSIACHGPYRCNEAKTSLLESHRWGRNPTFASQEAPATISVIPPERVANEILRILGVEHVFTHQTRFLGIMSKVLILDLVPDTVPSPSFLPEVPLNVRMDVLHNEEILAQVLGTGRRVNILTSKSIDLKLLSHYRAQILSYTHELEWSKETDFPTPDYVHTLKSTLPKNTFFTRELDERKLADLRFRYFDITDVQIVRDPTREDYLGAVLTYLNRKDVPENRVDITAELAHNGGELRFSTQRFVMSKGLIFLSYSHLKANQSITSLTDNTGRVIDEADFFKDCNNYAITFHPS